MGTAHRDRPVFAHSSARAAGRCRLALGLALGAGLAAPLLLGGCTRYDSMRGFYGRNSLVLSPDSRHSGGAIAIVPTERD